MARAKRPRRGRPPLGAAAKSVQRLLKLVPAQDARWTAARAPGETFRAFVVDAVEREIERRARSST